MAEPEFYLFIFTYLIAFHGGCKMVLNDGGLKKALKGRMIFGDLESSTQELNLLAISMFESCESLSSLMDHTFSLPT